MSSKLVTRFMQAVLILKPPPFKRVQSWDPDEVLLVICSWLPAQKLVLTDLAAKTAFLVQLTTGCRITELGGMDLNHYAEDEAGCTFILQDPVKTYTINNMQLDLQEMYIPKNLVEKQLCPVYNIRVYRERTTSICLSSRLFISSNSPFDRLSH